MSREEKKKRVLPIRQALCMTCADKIKRLYDVDEVPGSERWMDCSFCYLRVIGRSYDIWPHAKPVYKKQTGAGERARASE